MNNRETFKVLTANPVFYRTYSRFVNDKRESWSKVCDRTISGLVELGKLTEEQASLIERMQRQLKTLPSGRWLWVGGTDWVKKPENFYGAYNCFSEVVIDWDSFGHAMNLAMQGTGTGTVLEDKYINQLPKIVNKINLEVVGEFGSKESVEDTLYFWAEDTFTFNIRVGDSRRGWVGAYKSLLYLVSNTHFPEGSLIKVIVDISHVRKSGEKLRGFGGTANPIKLKEMFERVAKILNKAVGRQLTAEECCLLLDVAALAIVAGNIRRSASMRQFDKSKPVFKLGLWKQDDQGNWFMPDPDKDVLRMANHTRNYHTKPSLDEITKAVRLQYESGEGAIQFSPEAIARGNSDLLNNRLKKNQFINEYCISPESAGNYLQRLSYGKISEEELEHRLERYGVNPCSEVVGKDFLCNLSEVHLNNLDPFNWKEQEEAFKAGAIAVASLLNHKFVDERFQRSRELDPIVGVSFTGLFDFFVNAFGVDWLEWWKAGRPNEWDGIKWQTIDIWKEQFTGTLKDTLEDWDKNEGIFEKFSDIDSDGILFKELEKHYLSDWCAIVHKEVRAYCDAHSLKRPNRCTLIQPAGSKSLLTGASCGFHPPKAARYIRRITFAKNDPVALACLDYGYSVVPSQSDTDESGKLLNNPFDSRCTEWLVEIPVEVSWANLSGADKIDISKFSALAQFDWLLQVQNHYATHTTSNTIELREDEIQPLANRIYEAIQNDEGYVSTALLARFDSKETYPRLPFEPISKEVYEKLTAEVTQRQKSKDFHALLQKYDEGDLTEAGPAGCDSDLCLLPEKKQ